jgi:hypothetical protein
MSATREATSYAVTRQFLSILWNPKVHYSIHNTSPFVSILSRANPVHSFSSYLYKIHLMFYVHLPFVLPISLLLSGFPTNNLYAVLFSLIRATYLSYFILLYFIILIILGEEYSSRSSSLCSFLHPPINPSLFVPNIFLSTLFLNTLNLGSSHNVRGQVSLGFQVG